MKSILLIGSADSGYSMALTEVKSESELTSIFGTKGSLIQGYRMLKDTLKDTEDVRIMLLKVGGEHKKAYLNTLLNDGVVLHNSIELSSIYSEEDFDASIQITDTYILFEFLSKKIIYEFSKFTTIGSLLRIIDKDSKNGMLPFKVNGYDYEIYSSPIESLSSVNSGKIFFSKGESGINDNKNEIYHKIEESFNYIVSEEIDVIVPIDCFIDNTVLESATREVKERKSVAVYTQNEERVYTATDILNSFLSDNKVYVEEDFSYSDNDIVDEFFPDGKKKIMCFYKLFLDFCKNQEKYGIITKAVLGFKRGIQTDRYYELYSFYIDSIIDKEDDKYKSLISVTLGDMYYDMGAIIDNSYISYAAAYINTPESTNIENASCGEDIKFRDNLGVNSIKKLKHSGFIFYRYSPLTKRIHFLNTKNKATGILKEEYIIRSLQMLYKLIKKTLEDKIGQSLTDESINKFEDDVSRLFSKFVNESLCTGYNFGIKHTRFGDTYIKCDLFFLGYLSPFSMIVDLGGDVYEQ